jgi:hypothetical protein
MNDVSERLVLVALETGPVFVFSDWPIERLPAGPGFMPFRAATDSFRSAPQGDRERPGNP